MPDSGIYGGESDFSNNYTPSNDIGNAEASQNLTYFQEYNLRVSKRKTVIAVDITVLDKICEKCQAIQETTFPFEEIFLSVASLLLGVFLNALVAGIKLDGSALSVFSYVVSPAIAVGCGVAYFFLKRTKHENAKQLTKEILEYIADIEDQCDCVEDVTAKV